MLKRAGLCALALLLACSIGQAADELLLDHLMAIWDIPSEPGAGRYPIQVFRMQLDVTGDGKPELFLGTTWGGSRRGIPWVVYTTDADGRYRPLGVISFSYESFYYSASGSTIFAPTAGGPGTGGDFAYYRVGANGIAEVMDSMFGAPAADLVKLDAWRKNGRPPMYVINLDDLRASAPPQWRDSVSGKVEPSLGKLDGTVTESGACSAERFLGDYRGAGCTALP